MLSHRRSAFVPHDINAPLAGAAQGPLAGLTAAVKDMFDIAGERTGDVALATAFGFACAFLLSELTG